MSINTETFVWPSMGIEPPNPEDAIYEAGDQPIAGFDNFTMWAVTSDIHAINDWMGSHGSVHEAGGDQAINLDGLSVGSVTLAEDGNSLLLGDGVEFDFGAGNVPTFPDFATEVAFDNGLVVGDSIDRASGETIYDYTTDRFHRAEHALDADEADEANNSQFLRGIHPEVFLQSDQDETISGEWAYDETVDADISGEAAFADEADWAAYAVESGFADEAGDADTVEDHTVNDILDLVGDGDFAGTAVDISDDGQLVVEEADEISFDEALNVDNTGSTAEVGVGTVAEADHANYADDSDQVDGYHASELVNLAASRAGDDGRWIYIDDWQIGGVNETADWHVNIEDEYEEIWDIYKLVIVHENLAHTGSPKSLDFQINGDDRFRYNHKEERSISVRAGTSNSYVEVSVSETVTNNSSWPVCRAERSGRAVAEYKVAAPNPMHPSWVENKPQLSVESYSGNPDTDGIFLGGDLDTTFDDVQEFDISTDHYAAVYLQLWGTQLDQVTA